jgi:hypothetical protein
MDFSREPIASIDYSPYRPSASATLLLEEKELRDIEEHRYERFIRVWYTERDIHTSCLKDLILVLRPSTDSFQKELFMKGINQFLEMFHRMAHGINIPIRIYIDNWSSHENQYLRYERHPTLIIERSRERVEEVCRPRLPEVDLRE